MISAAVVSRLRKATRSTLEPSCTGTFRARPAILPFRAGRTRSTISGELVGPGMMFSAPERLPRSEVPGTSARRASLVRACTVVNKADSTPKWSSSTRRTGATALEVFEPRATMVSSGPSTSSLTPMIEGVHVVGVFRRRGQDHTLGALVEVLAAGGGGAVLAGGLHHHLHPVGRPVDVAGVAGLEHRDGPAVHLQVPGVVEGDLLGEAPEHRVVLEQVNQGLGVGDIHDGRHLDARVALELAEDVAADAAEAHQAYSGLAVRHRSSLLWCEASLVLYTLRRPRSHHRRVIPSNGRVLPGSRPRSAPPCCSGARADQAGLFAEARRLRGRGQGPGGHLLPQGVPPAHHPVPGPLRLLHLCRPARGRAAATCEPEEALESPGPARPPACTEALLTLGDRPEDRWPAAREFLARQRLRLDPGVHGRGWRGLVAEQTALVPARQPGDHGRGRSGRPAPLVRLHGPDAGEHLTPPPGAGDAAPRLPGQGPGPRMATLRAMAAQRVPLTTGVLVGIGETPEELADSLFALAGAGRRDRRRPGGHRAELPGQAGHPDAPRRRAHPAVRGPGGGGGPLGAGPGDEPAGAPQPHRPLRGATSTPGSTTGAGSRRSPPTG